MDYPKRPPFFAHRFTRLLHKAAVAAEIGRDAFSILIVVVHTEDAMRYRGPAKFWNSQLIETMGFSKWDQFDAARKRAIQAGWLNYCGNGKRKSGEYFVLIPNGYNEVSDTPIEESYPDKGYKDGYKDGYDQGVIDGIKTVQTGVQTGDEQGEPSVPVPDPKPKIGARSKFTIPTTEQVASYCKERGNAVDAETFVDFNTSKGWMVGKNGMKDWKAAVRTWEKREKSTPVKNTTRSNYGELSQSEIDERNRKETIKMEKSKSGEWDYRNGMMVDRDGKPVDLDKI